MTDMNSPFHLSTSTHTFSCSLQLCKLLIQHLLRTNAVSLSSSIAIARPETPPLLTFRPPFVPPASYFMMSSDRRHLFSPSSAEEEEDFPTTTTTPADLIGTNRSARSSRRNSEDSNATTSGIGGSIDSKVNENNISI